MKKLVLAIVVGLASNFATAQSFDFGVKAGAVFNTDKGEVWHDAGNIFKRDGKASSGFQAGVLARVGLTGLYIQPELLYSQFKNEYSVEGANFEVTKKRLDIPVAIGKRFLGIAHVQAGPVFSYYFDDKVSIDDLIKAKQDEFNVGLHVGGGVQVSKLLFDLRYEFGLGKVASDYVKDNYKYTTENRPQMLNLSVGYLF